MKKSSRTQEEKKSFEDEFAALMEEMGEELAAVGGVVGGAGVGKRLLVRILKSQLATKFSMSNENRWVRSSYR